MNIVFIFADDWGRHGSAYAPIEGDNSINHCIHTPNFDRIAKEGALFTNALVPAPSCTPCRSSVLSGKYFWQTGLGSILQGAKWDESIPSYPLELEKNGWFIGHSYKVWSPGDVEYAPYGATRTSYDVIPRKLPNFSQNVTKRAKQIGIEAAKEEIYEEVRRNVKAFLADRPEDKPFCYWYGPNNTHRLWEKGSGKALWNLDSDQLKGKLPDFVPDVAEIREDYNDYLGETLALDHTIGVVLEELEKEGVLDDTLVVVSGDHGIAGIPRAKCNLYNLGCEVALAMRWPDHIASGRVIEDFVNLMDLAPTFLDVAEVGIPFDMAGKSLKPIMESGKSGIIDTTKDYVVTGRERHVKTAREGNLPYPQRAIHTKDFLYIINFESDRWPAGEPRGITEESVAFDYDTLCNDSFVTLADMDSSPTKAWMIFNRNTKKGEASYHLAFDKRPLEELYDLRKDPHYMNNIANQEEYAKDKEVLKKKLYQVLIEQNDPRMVDDVCRFDYAPYAG